MAFTPADPFRAGPTIGRSSTPSAPTESPWNSPCHDSTRPTPASVAHVRWHEGSRTAMIASAPAYAWRARRGMSVLADTRRTHCPLGSAGPGTDGGTTAGGGGTTEPGATSSGVTVNTGGAGLWCARAAAAPTAASCPRRRIAPAPAAATRRAAASSATIHRRDRRAGGRSGEPGVSGGAESGETDPGTRDRLRGRPGAAAAPGHGSRRASLSSAT